MGQTTIEWTDRSWNPVTGCTKCSPGCAHCYGERMSNRLRGRFGYPSDEPFRVTLHPDRLEEPLKIKTPKRFFGCSMGDLFHEDVPFDFIDKVVAVGALCPQHTLQILSKRPERMAEYCLTREEHAADAAWNLMQSDERTTADSVMQIALGRDRFPSWPPPNFWLGTSVENQEWADKRIPHLLRCPAAVRFLSLEPLLGEVDTAPWLRCAGCGYTAADKLLQGDHHLCRDPTASIHQVIVGAESGPGARPMDLKWARKVRDECQVAGVKFFMKQICDSRGYKIPFAEWPADLQIQEMPNAVR